MDFQRINENTVQCRMTEEEMNSYGFQIEDFFNNQEKSREFLEQIVERAEEEVGYQVESGMVSMQLMRMPDNSLTITFSDKGEDTLQNMLQHVQNLANMIEDTNPQEIEAYVKELAANEEDDVHMVKEEEKEQEISEKEKKAAYRKHMKEVEKKKAEKAKKQEMASKIFKFASLHDLETFASTLFYDKKIASKVYKDNASGEFYLLVKKGKLKLEEYSRLCQHLTEYAVLCSQQPHVEQYCKEHFECLISKHALDVLKNL